MSEDVKRLEQCYINALTEVLKVVMEHEEKKEG